MDTTFKLNVKGNTTIAALRSLGLIGHITSEAGPDTGQFLVVILHRFCKVIPFTERLILPIFDCV